MKETKPEWCFTARSITSGRVLDVQADGSTFEGKELSRVELDFPVGTDEWEGIRVTRSICATPPIPPLTADADIGGSIAISFELVYKWRSVLKDAWNVESWRGKMLADVDTLKRFAGFFEKSFEDYVAENKIDLGKPDRPAQTGVGQQFYVELTSGGKVVDAYYLGDSEDLGYKDDDSLGFYGRKSVTLYIQDSCKVDLSDMAINLYIGAPGSCYVGSVWFGGYVMKNVTRDAFPPELVVEPAAPARPLFVGDVDISPIDKDIVPAAADAFGYLKGVAEQGCILYGVQNYPYTKGGLGYKDAPADTSDVYDLVGTVPSIFGIDSLSLIGMERAYLVPEIRPLLIKDVTDHKNVPAFMEARAWMTDDVSDHRNIPLFIKGSVLRSVEAWKKGSITTLSIHMSDPGMVYDHYVKDNKNVVTGRDIFKEGEKYPWNFHGYGYGNSTRTAFDKRDNRARSAHDTMLRMYRSVTGTSTDEYDVGVLRVFDAYLDITADFCLALQEQGIPVLYRPFHENSGDWFWWGNSGCENEEHKYDPDIFKRNWRHIVEHMYKRGVHNCIYVYSPNGPDFDNEEKMYTHAFRPYAITYPGDEWVDICAYDDYTHDEAVMRGDIVTVSNFAAEHDKLAAASEVTGSPTDPAVTEWLFRTIADTSHLPVNMSYLLQWTPPVFSPFLASPARGNSGAVNQYIRTLGGKRVVLANETNGFKPSKVNIIPARTQFV